MMDGKLVMEKQQSRIWQRFARYFLAGVFAVLPLVITVLAVTWVISFLTSLVGPNTLLGEFLSKIGLNFVNDPRVAYVLGWLGVLTGILVLGFFVESGMKGLYARVTEAVFKRVPLIDKVYDASKQLVDMLDTQGDDKLKGMSVAFCSFGEKGGAGVLALLPTRETIPISKRDYHIVLVPQSPVPIGGGLLFVPVESVEHVEMSVDVFMSIYVSMGVTVPKMMRDADDLLNQQ